MMNGHWLSLKKGPVGIQIAYARTFTNNLSASDFRTRISTAFEISLDLNGNLRTKDKLDFSYIDARHLAEGKIDELELVQISDKQIIRLIEQRLKAWGKESRVWLLRISLNGEHVFRVQPKVRERGPGRWLSLHVVGGENNVIYLRPGSK